MISATDAQVGQLLIYGPKFAHQVHRAAGYVDRILKGVRPSDLPGDRVMDRRVFLA